MELVEAGFTQKRYQRSIRRIRRAPQQVEIGKAAARLIECFVHAADAVVERGRQQQAIALAETVEPGFRVFADGGTDAEQVITVGWPADPFEQPVLLLSTVPGEGQPSLVAPHEPVADRDHGIGAFVPGLARLADDARRQQVCAVDHDGQVIPSRLKRGCVDRGAGGGIRCVGTEQAEFRAETGDPFRIERRVGAVVDAQDLVGKVVRQLLVIAAKRSQGALGLASHVVEVDDHREGDTGDGSVALQGRRAARRHAIVRRAGTCRSHPERRTDERVVTGQSQLQRVRSAVEELGGKGQVEATVAITLTQFGQVGPPLVCVEAQEFPPGLAQSQFQGASRGIETMRPAAQALGAALVERPAHVGAAKRQRHPTAIH